MLEKYAKDVAAFGAVFTVVGLVAGLFPLSVGSDSCGSFFFPDRYDGSSLVCVQSRMVMAAPAVVFLALGVLIVALAGLALVNKREKAMKAS